MDINEYEQRIGKSRHIEVKIECEYCGEEKWVRTIRLKKGQGRFCSLKCANEAQKKGKNRLYVGKENAKPSFNKEHQRWDVYWFDPDTLKRKTSTYSRWYWETFRGEIPPRYRASYKDGNSANIDPDNIILISPKEFGSSIRKLMVGREFSDDTKQKMSNAKKGKKLTAEHRKNIGKSVSKRWKTGEFESIHVGENHRLWKGGMKLYPRKFSEKLKLRIKHRDLFLCQSCGANVYRSRLGHVHHIDADKQNCSDDNLLLLCASCHNAVHGRNTLTNDKIEQLKLLLKL